MACRRNRKTLLSDSATASVVSGFRRLLGYLALVATPTALLASSLFGDVTDTPLVGIYGLVGLTGATTVVAERDRVFGVGMTSLTTDDALDAVAVVAGAVLAHVASVDLGLGSVVASALIGLLAGLLTPRVDAAAYCGSFVGMASAQVFPAVEYLFLAGGVSAVAYVAAKGTFAGVGGKLGTLALFGCVTTVALTGAEFAAGEALPPTAAASLVPVAALAAVATVVVSQRFDHGAVVGSALVGLVAGLLLPEFGSETLAVVAFCATFVGMSAPDRLRHEGYVALAGALSGLVFIAVATAFAGAGGKLGTIAFVACISTAGVERLV
jgi:hypothetical protein